MFILPLSPGQLACNAVPCVQVTAVVASTLTLSCIAAERYQSIVPPLRSKRHYTSTRTHRLLAAQGRGVEPRGGEPGTGITEPFQNQRAITNLKESSSESMQNRRAIASLTEQLREHAEPASHRQPHRAAQRACRTGEPSPASQSSSESMQNRRAIASLTESMQNQRACRQEEQPSVKNPSQTPSESNPNPAGISFKPC
ncbi:UNVERIFIED_CONTAM: hypothetical protein FKN15_019814 [Acipenser sinensis]